MQPKLLRRDYALKKTGAHFSIPGDKPNSMFTQEQWKKWGELEERKSLKVPRERIKELKPVVRALKAAGLNEYERRDLIIRHGPAGARKVGELTSAWLRMLNKIGKLLKEGRHNKIDSVFMLEEARVNPKIYAVGSFIGDKESRRARSMIKLVDVLKSVSPSQLEVLAQQLAKELGEAQYRYEKTSVMKRLAAGERFKPASIVASFYRKQGVG